MGQVRSICRRTAQLKLITELIAKNEMHQTAFTRRLREFDQELKQSREMLKKTIAIFDDLIKNDAHDDVTRMEEKTRNDCPKPKPKSTVPPKTTFYRRETFFLNKKSCIKRNKTRFVNKNCNFRHNLHS